MEEIWKDIPHSNGKFQASTLGNIRKVVDSNYVEVKKRIHPDGYWEISGIPGFVTKGGLYVHRLVAMTFLPNPDNCKIVDHLDNDHLNNNVNNLEWVSQKENLKRARLQGKGPKGKRRCRCIETEQIFNSMADASRKFNIRYCSIYGACETGRSIHGLHFEKIKEE